MSLVYHFFGTRYILDVRCNSEVVVDVKLNYTVAHKNVTVFIFVISVSRL